MDCRVPHWCVSVSGPFKINGVPLRRVNPAYVAATSTSVDIAPLKADAVYRTISDKYFAKAVTKKAKKSEADFLVEEETVCGAHQPSDPVRVR